VRTARLWLVTAITLALLAGLAGAVSAHSEEEPEATATAANEAAYLDAFLAQDLDAIMATFTDDAVFEDQTFGDHLEGTPAVRGMERAVFRLTDPEATELLDHFVSSDGSRAVMVWRWAGTSAMGREFDLPTLLVHEYRDGRIAKESIYYAARDTYAQLTESTVD
jgi:steroid delta-isomerase-like uncharacterized protein